VNCLCDATEHISSNNHVVIVLVGEKRGGKLLGGGRECSEHHEGDTPEQSKG
jgi:hypothetical protein